MLSKVLAISVITSYSFHEFSSKYKPVVAVANENHPKKENPTKQPSEVQVCDVKSKGAEKDLDLKNCRKMTPEPTKQPPTKDSKKNFRH